MNCSTHRVPKSIKIANILAFSSFGSGGAGHAGGVPPPMSYLKSSPYTMNGLGLTVSPMDMHSSMGYPPGERSYYDIGKPHCLLIKLLKS